jgi:hypothetical protein
MPELLAEVEQIARLQEKWTSIHDEQRA